MWNNCNLPLRSAFHFLAILATGENKVDPGAISAAVATSVILLLLLLILSSLPGIKKLGAWRKQIQAGKCVIYVRI